MDDDVLVRLDALEKLSFHNFPVVGGLVAVKNSRRYGRYPPCVWKEDWTFDRDAWRFSGLTEVGGVGLALTLTSVDVFRKLTLPYIQHGDGNVGHGEDLLLAKRLRAAGVKSFIDPTVRGKHLHSSAYINEEGYSTTGPWDCPPSCAHGYS